MKPRLDLRFRRAFVVMTMVITTMLATAIPALAHHPVVTGEAPCPDSSGKADIAWTVKADATRTKQWKLTSATVTGPDGAVPISITIGTWQANDTDFTGTTSGVGPGTYTLVVKASWTPDGPTDVQREGTVTVKDNCVTAVNPQVNPSSACDTEGTLVIPATEGSSTSWTAPRCRAR